MAWNFVLAVAWRSAGGEETGASALRLVRPPRLRWLVLAGAALSSLLSASALADSATSLVRGLPFTRSFPWDEIGNVSRGAYLNFDSFGRLLVVQEGSYAVLNDTVWLDLVDGGEEMVSTMANIVQGRDGRTYYGARGSWGTVEVAADGRMLPSPLEPPDAPKWTQSTSFSHMVATADGVYFAGWNGVVFWDPVTRQNQFFELPSVAEIFPIGNRVYASPHHLPVHYLDVDSGELRPVQGVELGGAAIEYAAPLDDSRSLIYVRDGRLLVFDGETTRPWPGHARGLPLGPVSALQPLRLGGVAVAVLGRGLFLLSPDGEIELALTNPEYHRITRLATNQPGVLWVATEDAVEKVLFGSPLTVFGQRLGLPGNWPQVVRCRGRVVGASSGVLYESIPGTQGAPTRFQAMAQQPEGGAWAVATDGVRLLTGNDKRVYQAEPDGRFTPVLEGAGTIHLIMTETGLCYVIGEAEIALLRHDGNRWHEAAPRIPALRYPSVAHAGRHTAWLEYGGNRAGRVSVENGQLRLQVYEELPRKTTRWVNVSVVDDVVVLTGAIGDRLFVDDRTGEYTDAPALQQLLARSPYWITRATKDRAGTIWGAYPRGVVTFAPQEDGDYAVDASTYDLPNDQYPMVRVLPGDDVWIISGRSLHHVRRPVPVQESPPSQPLLVSVVDARTNRELVGRDLRPHSLRLPFQQNSLSFSFFSGSYAWRRPPGFEYRLSTDAEWSPLAAGTPLHFSGLAEGRYHLEVRLPKERVPHAEPLTFDFEILPPWHRTWQAYLGIGLALVGGIFGVVRWSTRRSQHRNQVLQQLVQARTRELQTAMARLNEETRAAATLTERNRLAGEIHDSLQQGLSGLMLQLDATLKLPSLEDDVRSRLNVARNMVSFTRHEVQHAIWDIESPLFEDAELSEALRRLTALINSGPAAIEVSMSGQPAVLPSAVKHHLLRIAQEAITNAVRHAAAEHITIRLEYQPDAVSLSVADDGIGFCPQELLTKNIGHFGLRGLRGRAAKLRAKLDIESSPGQGTEVRVMAPLSTPALTPSDADQCPV